MLQFDERLCLEQLLKMSAYNKLYNEYSIAMKAYAAERPAESSWLLELNKVHEKLVKDFKDISCWNKDGSLQDSLGALMSVACAEKIIVYLNEAKNELEHTIVALHRPTKVGCLKAMKDVAVKEIKF